MNSVDQSRAGGQVLVVEDEYLIAEEIRLILGDLAFGVVGPVPTVGAALDLIESEPIDLAIIDINLHGESSGPVAEALRARGIAYMVASGYDSGQLDPHLLDGATRITKPFSPGELAAAIEDTRRPKG